LTLGGIHVIWDKKLHFQHFLIFSFGLCFVFLLLFLVSHLIFRGLLLLKFCPLYY